MRRLTIVLPLTLLLLSSSAIGAVLTVADVLRTRSVTAAVISPDGNRIAYALSIPRDVLGKDDDGAAFTELHVVDTSGNSRPYITGDVSVSEIQWTPDGRAVSFVAKRGKDEFRSLYTIDLGGGEARRVLAHENDINGYSWSPDGKRVAFLSTEPQPKKLKDLEKKGFNQTTYEESARPARIFIVTVGGSDKPRMLEMMGSASDLSWSPAGSMLAVAIAPTSLVDDSYTSKKVTIVDVESGRVLGRAENPGKLGNVSWSADGKMLAFVSVTDEHDSAAGRLVVIPTSGGATREILPNYAGHVSDVAWRDANTIVYAGDEGVWSTIGEVRSDGSGKNTLLPTSGAAILSIDVARNGSNTALVVDSPSHPAEVYLWQSGMRQPRRLTNSNPWLASANLAPQEIVRYKARDGVEIEGLLIRPLNEKKGSRYPLLLVVHGGPEAHYRNGWLTGYSSPGQLAAARGYAVFYPNYRGSTGRGTEFTKMSFGDPGGKEFDDLVDAVDHLVKTGLADRAKVGITGGSYGGYASAWGATKLTEHFAASVMFVGISNKVSKWGTTDIPNEEHLVHAGRYPSEDWMFFLQRSPIYYAGQSRTPTLILHGKDDPRVHPSQSMELYRHLKHFGRAPVRLILYPGEGHGNRRAASRLDYALRMMQWFDHYLKGPGGKAPPYEIDYDLAKPADAAPKAEAVKQEPQKQEETKKKADPTKLE